jgi:hypothetical protein
VVRHDYALVPVYKGSPKEVMDYHVHILGQVQNHARLGLALLSRGYYKKMNKCLQRKYMVPQWKVF